MPTVEVQGRLIKFWPGARKGTPTLAVNATNHKEAIKTAEGIVTQGKKRGQRMKKIGF